jgi:choline dehydrogenase-like flavoprotein
VYNFKEAGHLPKKRQGGRAPDPLHLPRQRRGITPQMHGRYPDYDVLRQAGNWDAVTREIILKRVHEVPPIHFFTQDEEETLSAFCDAVTGQDSEPRIPVLNYVDEKMAHADSDRARVGSEGLEGYQYADMPDDRVTWRLVATGLNDEAQARGHSSFQGAPEEAREAICEAFSKGELRGGVWQQAPSKRAWSVVTGSILDAFYGHPWAWNEIGFGGPAYPRGYMHLGADQKDPGMRQEAVNINPAYIHSENHGISSSPQKPEPVEDAAKLQAETRQAAEIAAAKRAHDDSLGNFLTSSKRRLKGAIGPKDNDSRYLLDVHKRGVPGLATMRHFNDNEAVDMLIVGCGAGGGVLAQRLARAGWKVVVLESGPFWDPDKDWVSDEKGSHHIYWNQKRIIGGKDPVAMGKNNSGHGVGGSMVHYAGYTPRFHPSDFRTFSEDGVGADWPISYWDLKSHYERVEAELPVAGQEWPWGDPHRYTFSPHPINAAAAKAVDGAGDFGLEMLVGPVGIANGTFGNRPHCIYRGFCLQGCKVNAKASPLVTHVPDAIAHGAEIRADSTVVRVEVDERGRCTGVTYVKDGQEHFQRAQAVTVAGYSIESPRLLLNSTSSRFPHGLGNDADQVGRYVMVQGAPQVAGRFPELLRMYRAPPPEVSSEQFYETDVRRGFKRGFSIQTVGPLPIGFAEHVLADGNWGHALREYMRDYNHWSLLGALCELLPQPENRVMLADEKDHNGVPLARFNYTQCDNDRANIAYAKKIMKAIFEHAGAQDILLIDRYAHLIGGCRMGMSPEESVVDADQRVWGVPNLFVSDGSACPTQGSANPALTIMTLSSRFAERLITHQVEMEGSSLPTAA